MVSGKVITQAQEKRRPPLGAIDTQPIILSLHPLRLAQSQKTFAFRDVSRIRSRLARRQIGLAWEAVLSLDFEQVSQRIRNAEWDLAQIPTEQADPLRREIAVLQASTYALCDASAAGLAAALRVSDPHQDPEPVVTTICRYAYWKARNLEALKMLRPVIVTKRHPLRSVIPAVLDTSIEAALAFEQLRLPLAARLARDAMNLADATLGANSATAALPASIAAQIAYEQGQLDEAEWHIGNRSSIVRVHGHIECAIRQSVVTARIALARGDTETALQILDDALALADERDWPRLAAVALFERSNILLSMQSLDEAQRCVRRLEILANSCRAADQFVHNEIRRCATFAKARLGAIYAPDDGNIAVLRRLLFEAQAEAHPLHVVHSQIVLAEALSRLGRTEEALEILCIAAKTGVAVGLFRSFLDAGDTIGDLFAVLEVRVCEFSESSELLLYLSSLLSHAAERRQRSPGSQRHRRISPMSEREREIVELISLGLPNKRIAQNLNISPETVKTHIKNIFSKLSVTTRTEAVRRAQMLDLI